MARFREQGLISQFQSFLSGVVFYKALGARSMKKTVQKFIGDAIRDVLKAGATPLGMDLPYLVQILKCFVIRVIRLGARW